jgi:branched-chain amino acid transport system ATP-binding protein
VTITTTDRESVSGDQPDALLRLSHVTAGYPTGGTALHDVSMEVQRGHVVGLLGANGAGKTTTLRAISGVLHYTGSVSLDGEPLEGPPHQRAVLGVAHVPEGRRIYAGLNVRENLLLGAAGRSRRERSDIGVDVDKVVELFPELVKHMGRSGAWLSGGEQQMVAIGRALMARPKVILLDEPTMGLAPIVVERLADVLKGGAWRDLTLVVAEENVQFAAEVSDTCVILRAGRVVWSGSAADLRASDEIQSMLLRDGPEER